MNATTIPTTPGYYRACVYASQKRERGVHQVVAVTDLPIIEGGYVKETKRVILQIGSAEPVAPDMVAVWGEPVDLNNQVAQERNRLLELVEKLACSPASVPDSELDWARGLRDRLAAVKARTHG